MPNGKTKKGTKPHKVNKSKGKSKVSTNATKGYGGKSSRKGGNKELITRSRTFQRGPTLFSNEMFVRMPYTESFQITGDYTTTTANTYYTYRLNSIFDPRYDTGGKQPIGYDTLALNYSRYVVYGAKIKVAFTDPNSDGAYVGIRLRSNYNSTTTKYKTLDDLSQAPFTQLRAINNTGQQSQEFSGYVDLAKAFSITRQQLYADDGYGALVTGTPLVQFWLEPFIINKYGSTNTTCLCAVNITYYVKFSLPVTQFDV